MGGLTHDHPEIIVSDEIDGIVPAFKIRTRTVYPWIRSIRQLALFLENLGFSKVRAPVNGWSIWQNAGLPVETGN